MRTGWLEAELKKMSCRFRNLLKKFSAHVDFQKLKIIYVLFYTLKHEKYGHQTFKIAQNEKL